MNTRPPHPQVTAIDVLANVFGWKNPARQNESNALLGSSNGMAHVRSGSGFGVFCAQNDSKNLSVSDDDLSPICKGRSLRSGINGGALESKQD